MRQRVGIPVVVDIVFVFIGSGDAKDDILVLLLRPVASLGPEAREGYQHLQPVFSQVVLVSGMPYIVKDGIGDGSVTVYLLEGNLPLIVALFAVHGDHGIKGSPAGESELLCVFNGLAKVFVPV